MSEAREGWQLATVFFSYSHKDEDLRDRLEVALSTMRRQGLIEAWHDRRLVAGDHLDRSVRAELERADVILLLVSPDFIASDYCYDVEMARAMERHERGEARVVPIILRHCDWKPLFGHLLAAPKDGKPVMSWPDLDEAFLDVAQQIRAALPTRDGLTPGRLTANPAARPAVTAAPAASPHPRSSNLGLPKSFTDADRDRFLTEAFEFMAKFFEGSLTELQARNPGVEATFRRIDANRFTAVVYKDGRAAAHGSVVLGGMFGRGITYSMSQRADDNSYNESLHVEGDDQGLFLKPLGMSTMGTGKKEPHLTHEGAAEFYWDILMRDLQRR